MLKQFEVTWTHITSCVTRLAIRNGQGRLNIVRKLFSLENSIPLMIQLTK